MRITFAIYIKVVSSVEIISDPKFRLELIFEVQAGFHLVESPLSKDQKITEMKDGRMRIKSTVSDTAQLRWWILGFGSQVEVVSPKRLRLEFVKDAKKLVKIYS